MTHSPLFATQQQDASRAAEAIQSLRNDHAIAMQSPILARLAKDMADQFTARPSTHSPCAVPSDAGVGHHLYQRAGVAGGDSQ